jgi:hypothetical protein
VVRLAHHSRQGELVRIWSLWAVTFEPPQSSATTLLLPPLTTAVLLSPTARTLLRLPPFTCAIPLLNAATLLKSPVADAVPLLPAKTMFPVPLAVAVLLLNAIARLGPVVVAVLLAVVSKSCPPAETATPRSGVCCVESVPVAGELSPVAANAVGAPMKSATIGAPTPTADRHLIDVPN